MRLRSRRLVLQTTDLRRRLHKRKSSCYGDWLARKQADGLFSISGSASEGIASGCRTKQIGEAGKSISCYSKPSFYYLPYSPRHVLKSEKINPKYPLHYHIPVLQHYSLPHLLFLLSNTKQQQGTFCPSPTTSPSAPSSSSSTSSSSTLVTRDQTSDSFHNGHLTVEMLAIKPFMLLTSYL